MTTPFIEVMPLEGIYGVAGGGSSTRDAYAHRNGSIPSLRPMAFKIATQPAILARGSDAVSKSFAISFERHSLLPAKLHQRHPKSFMESPLSHLGAKLGLGSRGDFGP
jgi:hypothetical protein